MSTHVLSREGLKRGGARERVIELLADQAVRAQRGRDRGRAASRGRPTGRASIYRVLDLLVEHGLVERLAVGDGQARFERADPDGEHHHHLVCDRCGRLVAFDDPGLERAIDSLSERLGVRIESHDVLLRGACRALRLRPQLLPGVDVRAALARARPPLARVDSSSSVRDPAPASRPGRSRRRSRSRRPMLSALPCS